MRLWRRWRVWNGVLISFRSANHSTVGESAHRARRAIDEKLSAVVILSPFVSLRVNSAKDLGSSLGVNLAKDLLCDLTLVGLGWHRKLRGLGRPPPAANHLRK